MAANKIAIAFLFGCAGCTPAPPPAPPPNTECNACDVRLVFEDKVDLVTLEHTRFVIDGKVVYEGQRWARDADIGPIHVAAGQHLVRALLVYRKDENVYDVRSDHEFTASEGLVLTIRALQGGSSIAPISERVAISWSEGH